MRLRSLVGCGLLLLPISFALAAPRDTESTSTQLCAYAATVSEWVQTIDPEVLKNSLTSEILSRINPKTDIKSALIQEVESWCIPIEHSAGTGLFRLGKLASAMAVSSVTGPVRFTTRFFHGLFTRKESPRGTSYEELVGAQNKTEVAWLWSLYEAARLAVGAANPIIVGTELLAVLDIHAGKFCRQNFKKTESSLLFCDRYQSIKNGEYEFVRQGESLGISVGNVFLRALDFRKSAEFDETVCQMNPHKQHRIAKRARDRLVLALNEVPELSTFHIFLSPPLHGGCVSLVGVFKNDLPSGLQSNGTLDGIRYSFRKGNPEVNPVPGPQDLCEKIIQASFFSAEHSLADANATIEGAELVMNPSRFSAAQFTEFPTPHWAQSDFRAT